MYKFHSLIFILMLFCVFTHKEAYAFGTELKQSIKEVDDWIHKAPELLCPGTGLALFCGNKICEKQKGENWQTCLYDCLKVPLVSYNGETFCPEVQKILIPKNIQEVQEIVLQAIDTGYRLRVSGKAHTINSQICTDGMVISTENLNNIIGMEDYQGTDTVHVEAGVTLGQLTSWLHRL